jgi:hypothetical protein
MASSVPYFLVFKSFTLLSFIGKKKLKMKMHYFLSALLIVGPVSFCMANPPFMGMEEPQTLIVHNRILAKVNDKTISVIDVMKKMDVFLNRVYPHLVHSKAARHQFYSTNWRDVLQQMIDDELMLIDSEGKDLKVTDGDVRETLQERFGPNVMGNLDTLGISYEEARKMIYTELVVQKMVWFRVNSKAIISVNPQDVKTFYREYCVQHPPVEQWKYQVLSIRAKDKQAAEKIAARAHEYLIRDKLDLQTVSSRFNEKLPEDIVVAMNISNDNQSNVSISVSEEYEVTDKEISQAHRQALFSLKPDTYSRPVSQLSRVDNTMVYRIFHLKDHSRTAVPPFEELEEKLENELIQKAVTRENGIYISRLRERLGYNEKHMKEPIPDDFQPFALN